MSKFNIGDEVKVDNEVGVITDRMYSEANSHFLYIIKPNNGGRSIMREESRLEPLTKPSHFEVVADIADNVVIGIIYEVVDGQRVEVCRGHGHIIHDGAVGVAQGCSYAFRRALERIDNGVYFKQNAKEK